MCKGEGQKENKYVRETNLRGVNVLGNISKRMNELGNIRKEK